MRKILLLASIVAIFASCSSKSNFELEVNINNNNSLKDKQFVITQKVEGIAVYTDIMKIKDNKFLLKIPYEGLGLLNVSIPDSDINDIMLAAEKGVIQLNIEGNKVHIGGTPTNDRLQAFYNGNDSISLLFSKLDNEYTLKYEAEPNNPQLYAEHRSKRHSLIKENTDRIVAFIKENVDNPVGEYYFMINYETFSVERKRELYSFATEKIKKEFNW